MTAAESVFGAAVAGTGLLVVLVGLYRLGQGLKVVIDEACAAQAEYLRRSAFIPDDVTVSGYVYEVESGELREPGDRIAGEISERQR